MTDTSSNDTLIAESVAPAAEHTSVPAPKVATRDEVIEALKTVEDPELFLDIWFLGLIYNIDINGTVVALEMTFTSPMCPAGPLLIDRVKTAVGKIEGVESVDVKIVFNPPWQPSDEVRALLGLL